MPEANNPVDPTAPVVPILGVEPTTDEPLGDAGKAALVKERDLRKAERDRADALERRIKEFEDRDKSDAQKAQEALDALRAENESLRIDNLRRDVAAEKGLTPALASRLQGSTREAMETDAETLLASFPTAEPTPPRFGDAGQGYRGGAPKGNARDQFAEFIQRGRT